MTDRDEMEKVRWVCVYCGSSAGKRVVYADAAAEMGRTIAQHGAGLVFGGGQVGLMGIVADACLDAGGQVIGVLPERLATVELQHTNCTELHVVPDMHARKALMADRADVFIALPGGIGTFEELFEIATWRQIGYHNKPVFVVNVAGFYDPLIELLNASKREGFLRSKGGDDGDFIRVVERIEDIFEILNAPANS